MHIFLRNRHLSNNPYIDSLRRAPVEGFTVRTGLRIINSITNFEGRYRQLIISCWTGCQGTGRSTGTCVLCNTRIADTIIFRLCRSFVRCQLNSDLEDRGFSKSFLPGIWLHFIGPTETRSWKGFYCLDKKRLTHTSWPWIRAFQSSSCASKRCFEIDKLSGTRDLGSVTTALSGVRVLISPAYFL